MASSIAKLVGRPPTTRSCNGLLAQAGRNVELADGAAERADARLARRRARSASSWSDIEHENDAVTHDIYHHLHSRPAVPFERGDVLALASGLDDVIDYAEEAADFLGLYRVDAPMDQAIALTDTLAAAGRGGRRGARLARRPERRHPPPASRSSGSRTRATACCARG